MTIKIGSTIKHSLFRGEILQGTIEEIEICKRDEKYGRPVESCDIKKHKNGVVTLDNGHWCYFNQIIKVINL